MYHCSGQELDAKIFHFDNETWTMAPMVKPGKHAAPICGRAIDVDGKDIIILAGSVVVGDKTTSYILDLEVLI